MHLCCHVENDAETSGSAALQQRPSLSCFWTVLPSVNWAERKIASCTAPEGVNYAAAFYVGMNVMQFGGLLAY